MKRMILVLAAAALWSATPVLAAAIDGTWLITRKSDKGEVVFALNLTSNGDALTGTYGREGRRRANPIADGKVSGDGFSFSTMQKTKKGENKLVWSGTVSGDALNGETKREGGRRGRPFTAKRK